MIFTKIIRGFISTKPTLADFKKTVADYLAWEVSQLLKKESEQGK